ncbi:methyltransferase type 11 [Coprinellus micaceus]|uniref:Methyltransferase type 11 n=1 Tax=Coprinellus micaceus TaxID=71717 RepID=A0A4Y7TVL7_COPMI|nr:methyltransferase type 11 [Coprinellus micaceus]
MGNSLSSPSPVGPHRPRVRRQREWRSSILRHLSLGCSSSSSSTYSTEPWPEVHHEKPLLRGSTPEVKPTDTLIPAPPTTASLAYYTTTPRSPLHAESDAMYAEFIKEYPEYRLTWIVDSLRRTDFARLERTGETYVDYMGGSLYPESLVKVHADFLNSVVLGNTHSISTSSKLSADCASEARAAVLSFFQAPPDYTVIFTANATAALKIVAESYPFCGGSAYILAADSHNSVNGIREFALNRGARYAYIPATSTGGFDLAVAKNMLLRHRPRNKDLAPCLFALTAQSNISNTKTPLGMAEYASSLGYHVVLDAAALAPTSNFSLSDHPVDAMAISFYKMFGFPTGVGALIVKRSFLVELKRPWFSGGTVDVVQVPGSIVTRAAELHEQFEDGTINYLTLPAITDGLRFLSAYLPFLPLRLSCLLRYLVSSLLQLRHDANGKPVVQILSRRPGRRLRSVGQESDVGFVASLLFLDPSGKMIPNSFVEHAATRRNISLRTGCVCNPGGAAAILGISEQMTHLTPGVTLHDFEDHVGRELGVVRVSLGLASNFDDVHNVIKFASLVANSQTRETMMAEWAQLRTSRSSSLSGNPH